MSGRLKGVSPALDIYDYVERATAPAYATTTQNDLFMPNYRWPK